LNFKTHRGVAAVYIGQEKLKEKISFEHKNLLIE